MTIARKLPAVIAMLAIFSSTAFAAPSNRVVKLTNFDDAGLATGPRDITIYLPQNYGANDARYPVIYFSDGEGLFTFQAKDNYGVDTAVDGLVRDKLIDPVIVVAISNAPKGNRTKDLTPTVGDGDNDGYGPGGQLDGYYRFISEKLKPYIDKTFRTKPEPSSTAIAGSSFGGLAAFVMAYNHPDTFGLAGCMSPSFWWDNEREEKAIASSPAPKQHGRFWLDAGLQEYYMWVSANDVSHSLEQQGWSFGDDIATYLDYTGAHNRTSWRSRMRSMLYFLFRKEQLTFEGYRLVPAKSPKARTLRLADGQRPVVGTEVLYTNGLRLTLTQPLITVEDSRVAAVNVDDPIEIDAIGPGKTIVSTEFHNETASLNVQSYDPKRLPRHYACSAAKGSLICNGDLSNWPPQSLAINDNNHQPVAYFGTAYDEKNIYIGVYVLDSSIVAQDGVKPWEQDGVSIQFNGSPEPSLLNGHEGWDATDELLVEMSPGKLNQRLGLTTNNDQKPHSLATETNAECVIVPGGYNAQYSFPISYIENQQGKPWKCFRLNICIYKVDKPGGKVSQFPWQPLWARSNNIFGSGIFDRAKMGDIF